MGSEHHKNGFAIQGLGDENRLRIGPSRRFGGSFCVGKEKRTSSKQCFVHVEWNVVHKKSGSVRRW